jgi:hypothetical protein
MMKCIKTFLVMASLVQLAVGHHQHFGKSIAGSYGLRSSALGTAAYHSAHRSIVETDVQALDIQHLW